MINNITKEVQKIFEAKKEYHKDKAKLPIEEKIKILIELQKIGKIANPEKTIGKRVWKI
ncbi:MAG: hypothetical protein M3R36_13655 [Bacteroidota bacterium]|nr:hypothetical protein [Bacteroidota bacterium]